jgi:hypothetical protein
MTEAGDKIRCDACPVLCYIRPGMTGACDRYANRFLFSPGIMLHVGNWTTFDQVVCRFRILEMDRVKPGHP